MEDLMIPESKQEATAPVQRGWDPVQPLIVLPLTLVRQLQEHPLLRDLFPTAAGHFPSAPGHFVERPGGLEEAIAIRVLDGSGWVETGTRDVVPSGSILLIPPGLPHAYGADPEDPWSVEWIHFRGLAVEPFISLLGVGKSVRILRGNFAGIDFRAVCESLERGYTPLNLMKAAVSLRGVLTEIHARLLEGEPGSAEARVRKSMEWMMANPGAQVTLPMLAQQAGLSVPHYSSIFRRVAGYPPMEHLRRLNIQRACQLLDMTEWNIGEIAHQLGWEDPLYFSRCFRRVTGQSPRAWRESQKG